MNLTPEELSQKIKEAQARQDPGSRPAGSRSNQSSAGKAFRAATDLVAAVAVGLFLGYWVDRWLGSKPFGMMIMLFLGFAAGLLSIYKTQMGQELRVGYKKDKEDKRE